MDKLNIQADIDKLNERCGTCNYFYSVRKYPIYKEILTHICVFHLMQDGTDYILETRENDRCECYLERCEREKDELHGEWIGTQYDGYFGDGSVVFFLWECSNCGKEYEGDGEPPHYKYCPNCGAKMGV